MPETIAILGASGKLGGATLAALLAHDLAPPTTSIVALTSSTPGSAKWAALASQGRDGGSPAVVQVRHASFEDPASLEAALRGVTTFFLVSTPDIALDFADPETGAPLGPGRDAHHRRAIDAAVRAGVRRLVYSSLAFAFGGGVVGAKRRDQSKAGVMRAHLRTEAYLREVVGRSSAGGNGDGDGDGGALREVVAIREGLYSESWPLYLGYFAADGADERSIVKLAGDGKVCWTAIADLGIANALVLVAPPGTYASLPLSDSEGEGEGEGEGKGKGGVVHSFYLSTRPATARPMREVAALVAEARGREVRVEVVGRDEHVRHYVEDRGLEAPAVRWWAGTYEALEAGECLVDDPTLEVLLARVGAQPTPFEDTVRRMVKGGGKVESS